MSLLRIARSVTALVLMTLASSLYAQGIASKPVRIVCPFPPGGSVDVVARIIAQELSQLWGQPVIVENRPGAGGNIGAESVAKANPDGATFLFAGASIAINASLQQRVPYVLFKTLVPVSHVANLPLIVAVNSAVPVANMRELVAYARSNPGKLNFGSAGPGTMGHVTGELLKYKTKVDMVHVPYKGPAAAAIDLGEGRIQLMIDAIPPLLPMIQEGKVRVVATPSSKRLAMFPGVPTADESGVPFENSSWISLWAPGGTPDDVIGRVSRDVASIIAKPAVRAALERQGFDPVGSSPEAFKAFVAGELDKWAEVVRATGAKID
jgi:tripartite-type tricarboxylate transporter receptor subunit TctC